MDYGDLMFYILDAYALYVAYQSFENSRKIKVETTVGVKFKWLVPSIVVCIALIGFTSYEGVFRMVQTVVLLTLASASYMSKSGLSDEGIVRMGKLYRYKDVTKVDINDTDCCVMFTKNVTPSALYFDFEQMDEVRAYLGKFVKLSKKKEIRY